MARIGLVWVAFLAALLVLSACSPFFVSTSSPSAPLPQATITTVSVDASPTQAPPPTATPHPIFNGPLTVKILDPEDEQIVNRTPIDLVGQADPGTVVTINDEVILVDQTKTFKVSLALAPGDNLIEITASNADNAQGFAYLNVVYEP